MNITIVATGMDGTGTLTQDAAAAIARAELLIGAERMLRPYRESGKALFESWDAPAIAERLRTGTEQSAAVLMSGDTGFFSGTKRLLPLLAGMDVTVLPGVAAPVYLCAKLGLSWEKLHCVSLHGTDGSIAVHVRSHALTCFLLGGTVTLRALCERLIACGLGAAAVYSGSRLGSEAEDIRRGTPAEMAAVPADRLCTVIVENPAPCRYLPCGIPDADFVRGDIPMTKAEVRALAVAALCVRAEDICWDIGCGTGSVTAELALRCPEGRVWAVDRQPEAVRLTEENARRFACDNVTVLAGSFPDVTLPRPDKVFLGGTGGRLGEILDAVYAQNPAARVVLTAVSLETLSAAQAAFAAHGRPLTITQIAVTRTRRAGSHTMLSAENPVFLLCAE